MNNLNPMLICDGYKIAHKNMYPEGTEYVYSTWTPRSGKHLPLAKEVVHVGVQGFIKEILIDYFAENFFGVGKEYLVTEYKKVLKSYLGVDADTTHIEALHDLGYLPLKIKSLPEGTKVPFGVPVMTVENTHPDFFWLTNYFETMMSANLWKVTTAATIAGCYREVLDKLALETTGSTDGVDFQGHDFSMRGMSSVEDAMRTGLGHLLFFLGTDTIPSLQYAETYYNSPLDKSFVGCSVPASEHSVMSAGTKDGEYETYRRLIEDVHPTGIVSIVSDTWDLWKVITETLPKLKDKIMARDGGPESLDKVVIRPDSGDPVDILCGDPKADPSSPAFKGVVELLYDIFGGTTNDLGYKVLDSHIGTIYGDSITIDRARQICERLKAKGFASTNVVLGIGSYTYQFNTRDSLGYAMKATSVTVNGKEKAIFKDPITDDGTKKSLRGRVAVIEQNEKLIAIDNLDSNTGVAGDLLEPVFLNGTLLVDESLEDIRKRSRQGSLLKVSTGKRRISQNV